MYSGSTSDPRTGIRSSPAVRLSNPQPNPLEMAGPPKRVNRIEEHIGERVASSKKRIIWTFTFGDCERVHEVVLVHSVMSYKKVIEFDGRQMHFDSLMTLGDWTFRMLYEGPNALLEVRINEVESEDTPKYDLTIDRVPFWRWELYRRRKQGTALGLAAMPTVAMGSMQQRTSPPAAGGSFGLHQWGPAGMTNSTPPPPAAPAPPPAAGMYGRGSFGSSMQMQSAPPPAPVPAPIAPAPVPVQQRPTRTVTPRRQQQQQQQEIDLIGDFGPGVSMSAQEILFDPLASAKLGVSDPNATRTQSAPSMVPTATLPGAFGRLAAANGAIATSSNPPAYVDPFANAPQPTPAMFSSTCINLDPLSTNAAPAQPMMAPPAAMPAQYSMFGNTGVPMRNPATPTMPTTAIPVPNGVNFSISQLLDPMQVTNASRMDQQQTKTINIDPFAAMQ